MKLSQDVITKKLKSLEAGDAEAFNDLFPYVYQELRHVARRVRWQSFGLETMNTTALVHEAYLKLVDQRSVNFQNRAHFFHVAARAMRQILINYANHCHAQKRGGKQKDLGLDQVEFQIPLSDHMVDDLLSLDEVLKKLTAINERQAQVVECRFFGGMSIEETSQALDVSPATVKRDWNFARAWLYQQMKEEH
jgi:RNA polymerase sigma factor (TIGR02999 family)